MTVEKPGAGGGAAADRHDGGGGELIRNGSAPPSPTWSRFGCWVDPRYDVPGQFKDVARWADLMHKALVEWEHDGRYRMWAKKR